MGYLLILIERGLKKCVDVVKCLVDFVSFRYEAKLFLDRLDEYIQMSFDRLPDLQHLETCVKTRNISRERMKAVIGAKQPAQLVNPLITSCL